MKNTVVGHWKLTIANWEDHRSQSDKSQAQEVPQELTIDYLRNNGTSAKLAEKIKVGAPWADWKSKSCLLNVLSILCNNNEPFHTDRRKSGCIRTGDNQLNGWTEKKLQNTSQSQTGTKKNVMKAVAGCCHLTYSAFWIPATMTSEVAQQPMRWDEKTATAAIVSSTEWA